MSGPIMLDVVGKTLDAEDSRRIMHPLTGGVILFARNYENRAQLTALTQAIHALRPDVLIAVDHEGGRVQRFREDGFSRLPAMRRLGELYDQEALLALRLATEVGYVLATELRACGVDFSFTPVLDLDYGESEVIGNRAFHQDARIVTQLAKSLNYGLMLGGMCNCGKHYPGHGFVQADSHTEIPVDERSLETIRAQDMQPYQWLGMSLTAVMPGHVIYPAVDNQPAGFSAKWIGMLRKEMQFEGAIFSDDLSMHGASVAGDVISAGNAALVAGCDMVLICNSPEKADQLLAGLAVQEAGKARQSAARIAALLPMQEALSWDALQQDVRYQQAKQAMHLYLSSD